MSKKKKKNKDVVEATQTQESPSVDALAEQSLLAARDFFIESQESEESLLETNAESSHIESTNEMDLENADEELSMDEMSVVEDTVENLDLESDLNSQLESQALADQDADADTNLDLAQQAELDNSELGGFEAAEIEDVEFIEDERLSSIIESILFASDRPVSMNALKMVFKGTNIRGDRIRRTIDQIAVDLAGGHRGVTLEEVPGGYQLRTKIDNMNFITRSVKPRQFRVSGPALEVLAIVAYKQPLVKSEIDEIRGVESGHLLRALMEKGLVNFEGKSDLPGKPMLYGTTKKFLEIFGLRNLKELPTLSQIDELLPEGIGEEDTKEKSKLSDLTESLSQSVTSSYSEGEEELTKISDQLTEITTTTDFFETEKLREKQRRDADKAQSLREAMAFGEKISTRDRNWLSRYDEAVATGQTEAFARGEFGKAYVEAKSTEVADGNSEVANEATESTVADMNIDAITDSIEEDTIVEDSIVTAETSDEDYHPDDDLALDFSDEDEEEALS